MECLMKNPGKVVGRGQIMTALWETDSFIDDNTLTVNMTRLRKKLAAAGLNGFILTKRLRLLYPRIRSGRIAVFRGPF